MRTVTTKKSKTSSTVNDYALAVDSYLDAELGLDQEWDRHPKVVRKYGQLLSDLQNEKETVEYRLKVLEAELDLQIRDDPDKFKLMKITETSIKNKITTMPEHKALSKALLEANHNYNTIKSIMVALEHKKAAIAGRVSLWIAQYYSEPKPTASRDDLQDVKRKTSTPKGLKGRKV